MSRGGRKSRAARVGWTVVMGWVWFAVLAMGEDPVAGAQARAAYEAPPTLSARDLVPAERLQGPGYQVDDAVPTAALLSLQLNDWYTASFHDRNGSANQVVFRPVIPFRLLGTQNIFRATLPYFSSSPDEVEGQDVVASFRRCGSNRWPRANGSAPGP